LIKVIIYEDRCKGCGLCIQACPQNLLTFADHINSTGYHPATITDVEKCKGCAFCAKMCPDVAIELEKEG
jgi:2-oxoglutarate ferredoxin oxidoreductase subunit delta